MTITAFQVSLLLPSSLGILSHFRRGLNPYLRYFYVFRDGIIRTIETQIGRQKEFPRVENHSAGRTVRALTFLGDAMPDHLVGPRRRAKPHLKKFQSKPIACRAALGSVESYFATRTVYQLLCDCL